MRTLSPSLAVILAVAISTVAATWQPLRVIDGDTVVWGWWHWRVAGIDAPETARPHCPEERALGNAATARLRALLASDRGVSLGYVGRDKYGRLLGRLRLGDGRDVAAIAIAEGWAHAYTGHGARGGWCPGVPAAAPCREHP